MRSIVTVAALAGLSALWWTSGAAAQSESGTPDLSGFWELRYDSFNVPKATLTARAAANLAGQEEHDRLAIRWCDQLGTPAVMAERQPLDIRQTPKELAIVVHPPSSTRDLYTDGRKHPAKDDFDPTTNGHSIGRWDGDVFVVDTIYFNDRGVTMIPGGGVRTPDSHLVERYHLVNNGKNMVVTFTWDDPKVFGKPHTYAYMYYRVDSPGMPRIYNCNGSEPLRSKFLTTPPQQGRWPE